MAPSEIYQNFVTDISQHWLQYSLIPIVAAVIGYLTKVAAVKMMFAPMEFVGWPPYLGWQGVVPRRAHEMAETIWDTLSAKLLTISDLVARLDPHEVVKELQIPLSEASEEITREVAMEFFSRCVGSAHPRHAGPACQKRARRCARRSGAHAARHHSQRGRCV